MTRAGLLLGRGYDPNVVRKSLGNRFEEVESPGIDAIIICKEDPHGRAYAGQFRSPQWRLMR